MKPPIRTRSPRRSYVERCIAKMFRISKGKLKRRYARAIFQELNGTVVHGPFIDMRLSGQSAWSNDIASMLLGEYEAELSFMFTSDELLTHDVFIDVGCADGYFAVGVAVSSDLPVIAYEMAEASRVICQKNANLNKVADKLSLNGKVMSQELCEVAANYRSPLMLIDIEGSELALFDAAVCKALSHATIILENHLVDDHDTAEQIFDRLSHTHSAQKIPQTPRDPFRHSQLAGFAEDFKYLMLSEERGADAHWCVLRPHV